jgi:hypothetical protein
VKDKLLHLRKWTAAGVLALFSLHQGYYLLRDSHRAYKQPADPETVANFEKRFVALRAQLSQSGCKKTGYVTDIPESDGNWFRGYFRTQYALAPTVVDYSLKPSPIVANLQDPTSVGNILRDDHLSIVSDYGNGVLLLSRQPQ